MNKSEKFDLKFELYTFFYPFICKKFLVQNKNYLFGQVIINKFKSHVYFGYGQLT